MDGLEAVDTVEQHGVLVGEQEVEATEALQLLEQVHGQHQPVPTLYPTTHLYIVENGVELREDAHHLKDIDQLSLQHNICTILYAVIDVFRVELSLQTYR